MSKIKRHTQGNSMSVQKQRTLGIIGGMSWESTESYYRLINEGIKGIKAKLGKLHSADLLIHSVDFAPIGKLQVEGAWTELGAMMASSAKGNCSIVHSSIIAK